MQWQHQICPSELPHGVAVALTEKALRIVQDTLSLYEALLSAYACHGPLARLSAPGCGTQLRKPGHMVSLPACLPRLDSLVTLVHAVDLERALLVR